MQKPRLGGIDSTEPSFRQPLPSPPPEPPPVRFLDTVGAIHRPKKRKPDGRGSTFEALIPESDIYTQLLDYERRVDAVVQTRTIEIADALQRVDRLKSVLRIYIWNESHMSGDPIKEPHASFWKLKISGRLLPHKQKPGEVTPAIAEVDRYQGLAFSYFIKSLEVEIDPQNLNGQCTRIKWTKTHKDEEKDVIEVLRPGQKILPLKISVAFDHQIPIFRLTENFSKLLGFELGTRSKVMTEMWNYIKTKNLQTHKDPSVITCDASLSALFGGMETIQLSMISGKLNELLSPADRVTLDYTLQLDGYSPSVYDVELELPSTVQSKLCPPFLQFQQQESQIMKLDRSIEEAVTKINEHKRRRTFFMSFSQSPIEFINAILKAQSKEVRLIKRLGEKDQYEVETQTAFFRERWVEDAIVKYFQRRLAAGN